LTSFPARRMEFADKLRGHRERAGLTGKQFADALGWSNSKVSKIETGKQTPSDVELEQWLTELGVNEDIARQLHDELREVRIHQIAWRRQLRTGHRARQEQDAKSERDAAVIRAVDIAAVPGLLQTPDYARAIFTSQAALLDVPDDVEASVRVRMERQRILYEPNRTTEILVAEAALRHPVCPPAAMLAQLDRLVSALGLPGVRIGVLPLDRQLPHVPWHGYWIVDDEVFIELVTSEVRVTDEDQVAIYHRLTDRLWSVAAEGELARALLARIAANVRSTGG
jgi:transcriptional regulator with XRE-family HTH domain